MTVLAIDTASRARTVVALAGTEGALVAGVVHRGSAVECLGRALAALALDGVTAVVCVSGPGTYTGLRAGLAAAVGVAQAAGLPLRRICSLDVVAAAAGRGERALAVLDAGRGAVYAAQFGTQNRGWVRLSAVERIACEALPADGVVRLDDVTDEDHLRGLGAAVPVALLTPAVDLTGITADYLDAL